MKMRKYSMPTFTAVIMILTALLFWGCSVRYVPDDSPWVEENNYYEYGSSGFHGNSPVYAPEYLNAWEMTKYYQYGERYHHEYVPDTTRAYGKSPGDFTQHNEQHNEEAYKRRETSMRSAPQQRVNSPRDANRRARLNARRKQIEQGKAEQSADDLEAARRAKLRQVQRIRNEKAKQQKKEEEDEYLAKQRRDKKIQDRNQ